MKQERRVLSLHALFLEFTLYMERHTYAEVYDVVEMVLVGIHFDWVRYRQVTNKEFIFLGVYGCMCIQYLELTVSSINKIV